MPEGGINDDVHKLTGKRVSRLLTHAPCFFLMPLNHLAVVDRAFYREQVVVVTAEKIVDFAPQFHQLQTVQRCVVT